MIRPFVKVKDVCLCLCLFFPLLLPVGTWAQSVLVAGGEVSAGPPGLDTSTAEAYDPAAATWTPTTNNIPTSPTPPSVGGLCAPNMVLLGNGIVLLAGGVCTDQTQVINGQTVGYTTNAASFYTPSANQWTAAAPMNYGRDQFGMVTLNGDALAFLGCSGACLGVNIQGLSFSTVGPSTEIYNFDTNQWTPKASFSTPTGNLSTGNLNQSAVVLQSGQVLACNGTDGNITPFNTCEIYDPVGNSWSSTGSLNPNETAIHQMALLGSGMVLTVSTVDGQSAFLFDPNSESPAWSAASSLLSPQFGGQLLLLSDGRILDCGGTLADLVTPVNTAQIYDPTSGTWSTTGPMGTARMGHIAVLLADGRVLVAGGQTANSLILSSAEIFDPTVGTWSPTTPMTQARLSANALLLGSLVAPVAATIATQPANQTINSGQTATLTVVAAGTQPLTYQWYQGTSPDTTNPISGATASSFPTPALTVSTSYWVLVSNIAGSVNSDTATITVLQAPTCTLTVQGTSTPLTVTATVACTDPQNALTSTVVDWGDGSPTTSLPTGSGSPSHTYAGADTFTVTVTATDAFELTGSASAPLTVGTPPAPPVFPGQSSSASLGMTVLQASLGETVTFSCPAISGTNITGSELPSKLGITCAFTPPSLTLTDTSVSVSVVIQTTGSGNGLLSPPFGRVGPLYALFLPLQGLTFLALCISTSATKRRRASLLVCVGLLTVLLGFLVACGGGFTLPPGSGGTATPPGSYFVTAVATDNSTGFVQTSLIVPLTVSPTP